MVLFINTADTSRHTSSANTAIYPNLGLLTLANCLKVKSENKIDVGYIDGTVYNNTIILEYIKTELSNIDVICFSVLTSNFGIAAQIAEEIKKIKPKVITIFGNDHFSALYNQILTNHKYIDYGFYGNDVVFGFSDFVIDLLSNKLKELDTYAGLVYRNYNQIMKNEEDATEYSHIPLIDYNIVNSTLPHQQKYFEGQNSTYAFMRNRNLKSQVIDIGRGCVKFSGNRINNVPLNACDFCGIIPGSKSILMPSYERAWRIIKNAYDQGFNYLYVTADELPLTMWNLIKRMADNIPSWYNEIPIEKRPKLFGYARAEGFVTEEDKIDILIHKLGFDHFFIGFDGLSEISLKVMNKQPVKQYVHTLMDYNYTALNKLGEAGCLITAGIVVTHLGITKSMLKENFEQLERFVTTYPTAFAALDFGPLCPIPGSQSFIYLTNPDFAEERARKFNLNINKQYLLSIQDKYSTSDTFEMDELINDFILGCCPDVTPNIIDDYMKKITKLAKKYNIVVGGGV
ncbi:MAG: cobalamin-dependent protein [Flavobacteriales bacterium]|nr:cobalamin-dependent protein [Flavobacteriales bacterium]